MPETWIGFLSSWNLPERLGLAGLQWSLLLAFAAVAGHLGQRVLGLPLVVTYALVGATAGLAGFAGAIWPLGGISLFLLEMGLAVVLFEAGARLSLRWFRHNPALLLQSALEALLTGAAVYAVLVAVSVNADVAVALALISVAASPAVLMRVVRDIRAAGPVTDRAITLATLNTLYALLLGSAYPRWVGQAGAGWLQAAVPVLIALGTALALGALLALALHGLLRWMDPAADSTSIAVLALLAASTALGGSPALTGLLAGILLKQISPRPLTTGQLGTAATALTMMMFVLVSLTAAQAPWNPAVWGLAMTVLGVRLLAKVLALFAVSPITHMPLRQGLWVGLAMTPMSSVALWLTSQWASHVPQQAAAISSLALPVILMMEIVGATLVTVALYRAGESHQPWWQRIAAHSVHKEAP